MSVIASCGHNISEEGNNHGTEIMDFVISHEENRFVRSVNYGVYCSKCKNEIEKLGIVLHNRNEKYNWLNGISAYPILDDDVEGFTQNELLESMSSIMETDYE